MYEQHWGLQRNPFADETAPEFFHRSETHQAALLKMRYVCENGQGAGLLAGGLGYGKTYVATLLGHELAPTFRPIVHVVFPQMTAAELLGYLAAELGDEQRSAADEDGSAPLDRTIRRIERRLAAQGRAGRHPVLIIDEAHQIEDPHVFRALQLLLNYRGRGDIDFSLLLVGERVLLGRVARAAQLDDRIAVKSLLRPLSAEETAEYVDHRLAVAGAGAPIFDDDALRTLFELSGGVPRRINRLADLALLVGYADGLTRITAEEVEGVSEELVAVAPD